ncbi:MAG: cardiolipin synthase [Candidatus Omnitrophica bacterium]|nr:cardiolipin synthase [Candidatus Omnitrophota bacterium]
MAILILIFQIYLIGTVIFILFDNRDPSETFAWIFIFVIMPGAGFVLYLFFGRNWKKAYDHKRRLPQFIAKQLVSIFEPLRYEQDQKAEHIKGLSHVEKDLVTLLYNNSHSLLTTDNQVKVYHNGKDKFDALKQDLRAAKKFIHLQYFIWNSNDSLGQELKEILIAKSREGVNVRILYDFSGCFFVLKRKYIKELRKENIKIFPFFNYLAPFKTHTFNYRNHRKIAVIDGEIGYTGGMNVAQEYIDGGKKYDSWRDTHIKITGEAVSILQAVFAIDWYNTTGKDEILSEKYFPLILSKDLFEIKTPIQLPTSGFDTEWPSILHSYFSLITMARKNIYICSPYFIPEPSIVMALKIAALRGVEVAIIITGVADQPLPYWAAFSYFEDVLKAGVKIYLYRAGFFHAKIFSCDGKNCSVGTANLDIRSFRLNYEINAVIYSDEITKVIDDQFKIDLKNSKELLLSDMNNLSVAVKLRNSLTRLISPLL